MHPSVIWSIFKRNFTAYFANPTGYVFICAFVLVSGFAAFWPHEFFNANLANLDQLNRHMPFILLGFVPAITMSLWADERRQGTDELLLTIPAGDFDVVLGKYLGAVAIYTVALLFSVSNVIVLATLGSPDIGLLFTTYFGYWVMGVAMLAVGMVASFLTANLTVGFVLGVLFNAPLVFAAHADVVIADAVTTQAIKAWSVGAMFEDFGRGVISLASLIYFAAMVVVGVYLSMVLIGRRHWVTGGKGGSLLGHFVVRAVAVVAVAVGLCAIFRTYDVRPDMTVEKLSSIASQTEDLLNQLGDKRIKVEAFISPERDMPEGYVKVRKDLLNKLNEIQKAAGGKIDVIVHEIEGFEEQAAAAEQAFGITPVEVSTDDRGKAEERSIYMGVAITSGPDKRIIPFVDRGVPTEYELIRAVMGLTQLKKKKIGVVKTDAPLFKTVQMTPHPGQGEPKDDAFIDELSKQYDVTEVDPSAPIKPGFDALLVVQPSSLPQSHMDHLIGAIHAGVPTAIFEDPMPFFGYKDGSANPPPGTLEPRRPPQMDPMMMRMGMQPQMPEAKGDIETLWKAIGARLPKYKEKEPIDLTELDTEAEAQEQDAMHLIRQDFNPFPKNPRFWEELVFVGGGVGTLRQDHAATEGIKYLLFVFPGHIEKVRDTPLEVKTLVATDRAAGYVSTIDVLTSDMFGRTLINDRRVVHETDEPFILAAHITGKPSDGQKDINVVLVSDIDVISAFFLGHRNRGQDERRGFYFDVDNVTFGFNVLDVLADEDRFIDIRKRRGDHRSLAAFEQRVESARRQQQEETKRAKAEQDDKINAMRQAFLRRREALQVELNNRQIDMQAASIRLTAATVRLEKQLEIELAQLGKARDARIKQAEADLELGVRRMQNNVKRAAVFIPPVLPLVIAVVVFILRRRRELTGVSRARLRA